MRILLIEDERRLSSALCSVLKKENYIVDCAYDGINGLNSALSDIYDAIVLDVMLPGKNGFDVLREIRRAKLATPILMLTALGELENRIEGLDLGADYYLPKPFDMGELLACLRTITRRKEAAPVETLSFGDVELLPREGKLICHKTGQGVKLAAKEFLLMELFLRNPKQILQKEFLIERVWGFDSEAEYNHLEVYISFLRKRLSFIGSELKIKATRGLGYSLEEES